MADRSDEGGDPACWAHLFEDEEDGSGPEPELPDLPTLEPCDEPLPDS